MRVRALAAAVRLVLSHCQHLSLADPREVSCSPNGEGFQAAWPLLCPLLSGRELNPSPGCPQAGFPTAPLGDRPGPTSTERTFNERWWCWLSRRLTEASEWEGSWQEEAALGIAQEGGGAFVTVLGALWSRKEVPDGGGDGDLENYASNGEREGSSFPSCTIPDPRGIHPVKLEETRGSQGVCVLQPHFREIMTSWAPTSLSLPPT